MRVQDYINTINACAFKLNISSIISMIIIKKGQIPYDTSRISPGPDSVNPLAVGVQEPGVLIIGDRIDERHQLRLHFGVDIFEGEQA